MRQTLNSATNIRSGFQIAHVLSVKGSLSLYKDSYQDSHFNSRLTRKYGEMSFISKREREVKISAV